MLTSLLTLTAQEMPDRKGVPLQQSAQGGGGMIPMSNGMIPTVQQQHQGNLGSSPMVPLGIHGQMHGQMNNPMLQGGEDL